MKFDKQDLDNLKEIEKGLTMMRAALINIIKRAEREAGIQSAYQSPIRPTDSVASAMMPPETQKS